MSGEQWEEYEEYEEQSIDALIAEVRALRAELADYELGRRNRLWKHIARLQNSLLLVGGVVLCGMAGVGSGQWGWSLAIGVFLIFVSYYRS